MAIAELTGADGEVPANSGAAHEARSRGVAIGETKRCPRQLLICISQLVIQVAQRVAPAVVSPKPVPGESHRRSAPSLRMHNFRRARCRIGHKGPRKGRGGLANGDHACERSMTSSRIRAGQHRAGDGSLAWGCRDTKNCGCSGMQPRRGPTFRMHRCRGEKFDSGSGCGNFVRQHKGLGVFKFTKLPTKDDHLCLPSAHRRGRLNRYVVTDVVAQNADPGRMSENPSEPLHALVYVSFCDEI